jgi:hypothetical protein
MNTTTTLGAAFDYTDGELSALALATIVIANADPDPQFTPTSIELLNGLEQAEREAVVEHRWHAPLADLVQDIAPERRCLLASHLATVNPAVPTEGALFAGALQRRCDAVLDVLDVPLSANDLQLTYAELLESLTTTSVPATWKAAEVALNLGSGYFMGFGSPGTYARKGMEWLKGRSQHEGRGLVEKLASQLLGCMAVANTSKDPDLSVVLAVRQQLLDDLGRAQRAYGVAIRSQLAGRGSEEVRQQRRLIDTGQTAAEVLRELLDAHDANPAPAIVPDLVEQLLPDAQHSIRMLGIESDATDADDLQPTLRTVWRPGNWYVKDQRPAPGSPAVRKMTLKVAKLDSNAAIGRGQ